MDAILEILGHEQGEQLRSGIETYMTVEFANRPSITGIIEGAAGGVLSIRRLTSPSSYADIPRHYAISAVIGAYYTEGS